MILPFSRCIDLTKFGSVCVISCRVSQLVVDWLLVDVIIAVRNPGGCPRALRRGVLASLVGSYLVPFPFLHAYNCTGCIWTCTLKLTRRLRADPAAALAGAFKVNNVQNTPFGPTRRYVSHIARTCKWRYKTGVLVDFNPLGSAETPPFTHKASRRLGTVASLRLERLYCCGAAGTDVRAS